MALAVNRTTGPTPLGIRANMIGSTISGVDTFRYVGYSTYSGDPTMGNCPVTGYARNIMRGGPMATFVYETAGTFALKSRGREDSTGSDRQVQQTITPVDADLYFSGTNTECLSMNSDMTGAKSGCQQRPNLSSWPTWVSGKRYLLHAGQDFSSLGDINLNYLSDFQLGKFGSGAKPIGPANINIQSANPNSGGVSWGSGGVVMDIQGSNITGWATADNWLKLRCDAPTTAAPGGFGFDYTVNHYANPANGNPTTCANIRLSSGNIIYECSQIPTAGGVVNYNVFSGGELSIVGCNFGSPSFNVVQHNIRLWSFYKSHVSRNNLTRANFTKHNIKANANGNISPYSPYAGVLFPFGGTKSEYLVSQQNRIGVSGTQDNVWACAYDMQNNLVSEWDDMVIHEDNYTGWDYSQEESYGGSNMIRRGNTGVGTVNYDTSVGGAALPHDGPYYDDGPSIPYFDPT